MNDNIIQREVCREVGKFIFGLSVTYPDSPVVENEIASGFRVACFEIIKLKGFVPKEVFKHNIIYWSLQPRVCTSRNRKWMDIIYWYFATHF